MSWRCILGFHQPSLVSISKKGSRLHALCDGCGVPLERSEEMGWALAPSLVAGRPLRKQAG